MKIANPPEFVPDPAVLHKLFEFSKAGSRDVVRLQGFCGRLRSKHAALYPKMNSFQPHGIKKTRSISNDQPPIAEIPGLRPIAAFRDGLRAIAVKAASIEKIADQRRRL